MFSGSVPSYRKILDLKSFSISEATPAYGLKLRLLMFPWTLKMVILLVEALRISVPRRAKAGKFIYFGISEVGLIIYSLVTI